MSEQVRYRKQTIDYLGTLQTKLRDLRGIGALTYELIQNADDVLDEQGQPGASQITFDIHDDALIVENDGVFRDVDFERMQNIASGGKRGEVGTTGAFGIGFISVYQITDHPEIYSSGRHWQIRPEAPDEQRIEERDAQISGTRFRFPWAFDPQSPVRQKLRVEAVKRDQIPHFTVEIGRAISRAALFLKNLEVLQVKRSGELVRRVERLCEGTDQILIDDGDQTRYWRIFEGSFEQEADRLRAEYGLQIETDRKHKVLLAIPDEEVQRGRLYAVLPSETTVSLPFHINADFYPSSDRKRIIFDEDYQSEWNRAAVRAAARALKENFQQLRDLRKPKGAGLWRFLEQLNKCRQEVLEEKYDRVFAAFWDEVAPQLSTMPIVLTSTDEWVRPHEARLLESEAEGAASTILEALDIHVVHPDLRPYYGLLRQREIGTPLLSVQDLVAALEQAELDQRTPLAQAPPALQSNKAWQTFWQAIDALLERRQSAQAQARSLQALRSCAIALDKEHILWPPNELWRGDQETRALFPDVPWLEIDLDPAVVPGRLVDLFTAEHAVTFLSSLSAQDLEAAWQAGDLDIGALYRWFEARNKEILANPELTAKLRALPIWPVGKHLTSLHNAYIPGGFEDPLKLSTLVDLASLDGRQEFLKDLGVKELTFLVYAGEQVPRVFAEQPDLSVMARRQLVQLLAQRLGELRTAAKMRHQLRMLDLIECTDGRFRPANKTYLGSEVTAVLGDYVHVAAQPERNAESVAALYRWLGVATEPRPQDVIDRVYELTKDTVSREGRAAIETVFGYLVERWQSWEETNRRAYERLSSAAWLPVVDDADRWYRPHELFAVFQSYLFETQARFLDLPRPLQNQAGRVGLIDFLGIEVAPSPTRVARHLLQCSEEGRSVNKEVYRFLNDNASHQSVGELKGKACLLLPNGGYVRPDQVYWGEHPFGPFRHQLGPEMRRYDDLLDRLEVQETPQDRDYIQVLIEISDRYGTAHRKLDDDAYAVTMQCWEALSTALEADRLQVDELAELCERPAIPDPRRVLSVPGHMFFEDRAGLTARFKDFLKDNVIQRPQGAWQAMRAVGVRLLGEAVEIHLLECEDPVEDIEIADRLHHRHLLISRVVESEKASGGEDLQENVFQDLDVRRANQLIIQYSLTEFKQTRETDPESVPALWLAPEKMLYVLRSNGDISWPVVARELAQAVKPVGEIGGLAGGLTYALSGASYQDANDTLDLLGYPPLQEVETTKVDATGPIEGFGGEPENQDQCDLSWQKGDDRSVRDTKPATVTPDEALSGILGEDGGTRTEMPPTEPETPDDDGRGAPGSKSGQGSDGRPKRSKKGTSKGKLRTYVVPAGSESQAKPDPQAAQHRVKVDQAGIARVIDYERDRGRMPTEMPHEQPGYDIRSVEEDGATRYIEVKSLSGDWGTYSAAGVSDTQFEKARELGGSFWLYIVERATDETARVFAIQDPVHRINQYLFDDGWEALAEDTTVTNRPQDEAAFESEGL